MARIIFGPFISRVRPETSICPDLLHTGYCVEFAGDEIRGRLNVYRKRPRQPDEPGSRFDYLVAADELTFGVRYRPYRNHESSRGLILTLEEAMVSLYRNHAVVQPLSVFLRQLKQALGFTSPLKRERSDGAALVHPTVRDAGFRVTDLFQYGTGLTVSFGWLATEGEAGADSDGLYDGGCCEFRPGPGRTLGKGKWVEPMEESFNWLLLRLMRKLRKGDPSRWLSEDGIRVALEHFKFSKVSLLGRKELVEARLAFIRDHPELRDDPTELARALRSDGLWSDTTELGVIRKQLPKLLAQL